MEDTYKGQVDNPLSLNRYTYGWNNPLRFTDPTGYDPGMILIDGKYIAGSDGIVYIQNGEIAWDYYVDWFRSDPEGFRTMVGSNDKMTAIAAVTPIYSMGGLPIAGSGGYGSAKYIEKAATGPTSKVTITNQAKGTGNSLTKIDNYVDLTGHRKDHILNRHRAGAGKPDKTEFPASWTDERILHQVSAVATDPNSVRGMGKWDSPYAIGVRDGIEIRVDFYPNNHKFAGQISTAYPTNVPANPSK